MKLGLFAVLLMTTLSGRAILLKPEPLAHEDHNEVVFSIPTSKPVGNELGLEMQSPLPKVFVSFPPSMPVSTQLGMKEEAAIQLPSTAVLPAKDKPVPAPKIDTPKASEVNITDAAAPSPTPSSVESEIEADSGVTDVALEGVPLQGSSHVVSASASTDEAQSKPKPSLSQTKPLKGKTSPSAQPQKPAKKPAATLEHLENVEVKPFVSTVVRDAAIQRAVTDCDQYIDKALTRQTNVHRTDKYYKPLWKGLNVSGVLGYSAKDSPEFHKLFAQTVRELQFVVQHINTSKAVNVAGVDMVLNLPKGHKKQNIEQALIKMREYGRHAGAKDWDNEVHAHVNQVLVYVWQEIKRDPRTLLMEFLVQLDQAGPTCIQGHTIRMLQSVHNYELRPKYLQVAF